MRNHPFRRSPGTVGGILSGGIDHSSPNNTATTISLTTTHNGHTNDFPSSKKNDDASHTMRKNTFAALCLNLPRWSFHIRMLALTKRRRIWVLLVSFLAMIGTTVFIFAPSPPTTIEVIFTEERLESTNIDHYRPRIVQLGPLTIFRRRKNTKEQWVPVRGSGDVTNVSSVQSLLPPQGSRKVFEQDDLSHDPETTSDDDPEESLEKRKKRESRKYEHNMADPFETGTCQAQYDWQLHHRPNCNHLMEQDLTRLGLVDRDWHSYVRFLANGYYRDVWKIQDRNTGPEKVVLKTLRYEHEFIDRNYDRHRRDAVAMEQLASSPVIVDIYGFCGNSGIFEYADGGSLDDIIFDEHDSRQKDWSPSDKVMIAYQIASALAAVHNQHKEGVAAIAHTDMKSNQYVYFESSKTYKLNDFNRCRFLAWDTKTNEPCTFEVGKNPGNYRSPEEYAYDGETEKVDVYSMGNIFYEIMTGFWTFYHVKSKRVPTLVKKGIRPKISPKILNSTNPFDQALLHVTFRCWEHDPKVRASAREIQRYLEDTLNRLGVPNNTTNSVTK